MLFCLINTVQSPEIHLRISRHIRDSDRRDFNLWFRSVNAGRTLVVGLVLLGFAVFWSTLAVFDLTGESAYSYPTYLYLSFLLQFLTGTALVRFGRSYLWRALGEWIILASAVFWMFVAVDSGVNSGFGLIEFIIGTLALAMLRYMPPKAGAAVFSAFAVGYALVLWRHDMAELSPINNGILFCIFAFILSVGNYNSKVLEFRNRLLLKQLNAQNHQLSTLAMRDALTDLPNRRYFDQYLDNYWRDEKYRDQPISLVMLDIDHFKAFNDEHGHPAGDACLQQVAQLLQSETRVNANSCRLGGEEFAILLPGATRGTATTMAERLLRRIRSELSVTVSLGVATTTPASESADTFYRNSDEALYAAKRQGRDRVVVASDLQQTA